jgi:hypothetical protein
MDKEEGVNVFSMAPLQPHWPKKEKKGGEKEEGGFKDFFRFRRWDIKRGGRSTGPIHYSLYKCARCVRLVRVVDASEPPVL